MTSLTSTSGDSMPAAKDASVATPACADLSVAANFSKLLEGDLYEDELNELPDLFLPTPNLKYDYGSTIFSHAAATAVVDAAFDQATGFALENKTPEPSVSAGASISHGHTSPTTDKCQMEMEFNDWAASSSAKAATRTRIHPTKQQPVVPSAQAPQLFGRRISLPKEPAPILSRRASLGPESDQRDSTLRGAKFSAGSPAGRPLPTPIAPKVTKKTTPVSSLGASALEVLAPAPFPSPALQLEKLAEPMFLPPAASAPSKSKKPAKAPSKSPSESVAAIAKETVDKVLQTKTTKPRRYKRKDPSMTEEEAEQEHRNRNKEHAKNTRLRKKAYVEALKESLNKLVDERDEDQRKANVEAQKKLESRRVRWQVMQSFLRLRGGPKDHNNRRLWTSILDDAVTLSRPVAQGSFQPEARIAGVGAVMADRSEADLITDFLESRKALQRPGSVSFEFECDKSALLMDGCTCILPWKGTTKGSTALGFPTEVALRGTLRVSFNEKTNKIVSATLCYDTAALGYQMNKLLQRT